MTAMEEAGMEMADWIIGKKLHLMPASSKKKHSSASSGIEECQASEAMHPGGREWHMENKEKAAETGIPFLGEKGILNISLQYVRHPEIMGLIDYVCLNLKDIRDLDQLTLEEIQQGKPLILA